MLIVGLIIILLLASILFQKINSYTDTKLAPKPTPMIPIRFFNGPLDGHTEEVSEVKPSFFWPHIGDEEDTEDRTMMIGGLPVIEPVYAKYEGVGTDGDYFYREDISRDEMMVEVMRRDQNG